MVNDEEKEKEDGVKEGSMETVRKDRRGKKTKRNDKKLKEEDDEKEEKAKQDGREESIRMDEIKRKLKREQKSEKMKKDRDQIQLVYKKDSKTKKDRRDKRIEKDGKDDGAHKAGRGEKARKIEKEKEDHAEKDEKIDQEVQVAESEKSSEKNKDKKDTLDDDRDNIDGKLIRTLTPEMANELNVRGIIFFEDLGKGTFSTVKRGWCNVLSKVVAIKIIDTRKDIKYTKKCLPREIELVRKLAHDNIIKVYEVIERKPYVCIIQDYTSRGDLLRKIRRESKVNEKEGKIHFRQLIEAMKYLKSMQVVHRDIKCENILLDSCENVKITDFGFARLLKSGEKSKTFCGSRAYLAPEIIRAQPYDGYLSDMWSAGVVLYVMTTGMMPYDDKNVKKMLERQLQHRIAYRQTTEISAEVKRLIFDILHPIPQKRLTIEQVLRSKWLADVEYRMLIQTVNDSITDSDKLT